MLKVTATDGRELTPGPERDFYLSVVLYVFCKMAGAMAFVGTVVYLWWKS